MSLKKKTINYYICYHVAQNKHINNLHTNQHNKAVHVLVNTLLAHPDSRCFTLINANTHHDCTLENAIPLRLLPCSCYLPKMHMPCTSMPIHPMYIRNNTYRYPPPSYPWEYNSLNSLSATIDSQKQQQLTKTTYNPILT